MYRDIIITSGFFVMCFHTVLTLYLLLKVSKLRGDKHVIEQVVYKEKPDYGNIVKRKPKFKTDAGWYDAEKKQRDEQT